MQIGPINFIYSRVFIIHFFSRLGLSFAFCVLRDGATPVHDFHHPSLITLIFKAL